MRREGERIADGSERLLDLKSGAEATFGGLFDEAVEYLHAALVHVCILCICNLAAALKRNIEKGQTLYSVSAVIKIVVSLHKTVYVLVVRE